MPLSNRLNALNEIDENAVYHAAQSAVAEEFLQPDLPKSRNVADTENLNRDLQRIFDTLPQEKHIPLRKAFIEYAHDHVDYTFGLPYSQETIGPHINMIDVFIRNRNTTGDLVTVANGVAEQIIERELERVMAEKQHKDGPKRPSGPPEH